MKIAGQIVVITGAASGIGLALAARVKAEGARSVVMADRDRERLAAAAGRVGGLAVPCDVTREAEVAALVARAEREGPIGLFVSNAGVLRPGTEAAPDSEWALNWNLHVMAHVYAARALMPRMAARGQGYVVLTASAAGLLAHVQSATYTVSKHATVAFGEYLAIAYGDAGIRVSVLAPQTVRTPMVDANQGFISAAPAMIEPDAAAAAVVAGIEAEKFLILPHPEVLDYVRFKTGDYDRWLAAMRRRKNKAAHRG